MRENQTQREWIGIRQVIIDVKEREREKEREKESRGMVKKKDIINDRSKDI